MIQHLTYKNKKITLIGTAHVSKKSVRQVESIITEEKPDTVCIELCASRYQSIRKKNKWQDMDIVKVIKDRKAFLLLSNLLLASFQKRIAAKLDVTPGQEMLQAIDSADAMGAEVHLADRDIRVTLSRTWRAMSLWKKLKLMFQLVLSFGEAEDLKEDDIEKMKQEDMLQLILADVGKSLPELKDILINERDQYLAQKIKSAPGQKIVAVVGAGHVPGIIQNWEKEIDTERLDRIPPGTKTLTFFKWALPSLIVAMVIGGFYKGGMEAGTHMITWWIAANGILAGIGAIVAFAHPLTILASVLAAPMTSLNPMIAAGWVSGLVEALSRKPKVKDFESLQEDITSFAGFYRNKVTRILMVVVFTNLGSSLGTMVAIPLMTKAFSG